MRMRMMKIENLVFLQKIAGGSTRLKILVRFFENVVKKVKALW